MKIPIKKIHTNAVLPVYAHYNDACMDVTAISMEYDKHMDCYIYHTGLSFAVPDGYEMQIRPRSSNRKTNAYLCNSPGTLDSGYRGELIICYKNRDCSKSKVILDIVKSNFENGVISNDSIMSFGTGSNVGVPMTILSKNPVMPNINEIYNDEMVEKYAIEHAPFKVGDRVAQIIIMPYPKIEWVESDTLDDGIRGVNNFGSTGN